MGPCTPVEIRRGFKFKEDEEALKKYRALKKDIGKYSPVSCAGQ